jgi:transposase
MRKERKHFTPEEKVAILRRHLVDKVPVSKLCEELGLRPRCVLAQPEME